MKKTAGSVLVALALSSVSAAQVEGLDYVADPESPEAFRLLEERNRETMHPGDPLRIMGGFEGNNDLRDNLRTLQRSEFQPVQVDEREAYERQLALLEGGPMFSSPTRVTSGGEPPVRVAAPKEKDQEEEPEPYDTTWIGMLLAAGASIALFATRGQAAPTV